MKRIILTIVLFVIQPFVTSANVDCIWISSKKGLTIYYRSSCDYENEFFVDSLVSHVVEILGRQDTTIKIHVTVNRAPLMFPNSENPNFFSIAYDTLRQIDDNYISEYYWEQEDISISQNGWNKYKSQNAPLDINATNNNSTNEIGIKIIYNGDYRLGEPLWQDIIKSISYAANNIDSIISKQVRDTVRLDHNGWYVSLVTIDTNTINRIIGKVQTKVNTEVIAVDKTYTKYVFIAIAATLCLLGFLFVLKNILNRKVKV
ncbi:MAG: hypothetical protein H6551_02630 [Chitinophagales bacterium]|nr:hypothetical protein [Chitinophagaceae bacterium]MCB9064018.1 hypothetical protein [Chitinophagales bacterium]